MEDVSKVQEGVSNNEEGVSNNGEGVSKAITAVVIFWSTRTVLLQLGLFDWWSMKVLLVDEEEGVCEDEEQPWAGEKVRRRTWVSYKEKEVCVCVLLIYIWLPKHIELGLTPTNPVF